jgi:type IV pilus assembly protein PilQ
MHRTILALLLAGTLLGPNAALAGGLISLDVRDLDLYDTVRLLATQASTNLVVDASVPHRPITLRLRDVPFEEALDTLVRMNDLATLRLGNEIFLMTLDALNRRYGGSGASTKTEVFPIAGGGAETLAHTLSEALPVGTLVIGDNRAGSVIVTGTPAALRRAEDLFGTLGRAQQLESAAIQMRFAKAADVLRALQASLAISPPASAYAADQQNAVVITGTSEFIERAAGLVRQLDRPGQQVRYEVRVTDVSPSDSSDVGVLFGGLSLTGQPSPGSASTAFLANSVALNATINALITRGDASILAQPSLSTLNNAQASLLVGQQFPIVYFDARTGTQQVQFVDVGVNLTVTPTIGSDGAITTDLQTDYSTIVNFVNNYPIIGTRKAQSTLRVRDGETIVIAGLFQDLDASTLSKVPFLADIPIVGELFKNRMRQHTRDEVVFLITPHLVPDAASAASPAPEPAATVGPK